MKRICCDIISVYVNQDGGRKMKIEFKNFSNLFKIKRGSVSAVILGAGSSERFGGNKVAYKLDGIPVFIHTLKVFDASPYIDEIVLVVKKEECDAIASDVVKYGPISKLKCIIPGGETRQKSALKGFEAINQSASFVAIHDAARCLITEKMIEDVCREAFTERAAAAAHKVTDTVKYADSRGYIDYTFDRKYVWLVSTPQIFLSDLYRAAAYTARDANFEATDDCMLAERLGFKVKLVEVGEDNIKLTYREDLERAEHIIEKREKAAKTERNV